MTDNEYLESILQRSGYSRPKGWDQWDSHARRRWLDHQPAAQKNREKQKALVVRLAETETFVIPPIVMTAEPKEGLVVRAVYGPLTGGYRPSFTLTLINGVVTSAGGASGNWGPKEFLYNVWKTVADNGGSGTLVMVHSGVEIPLDRARLKEWLDRSVENPAAVIMETGLLMAPQWK